MARTIVNYEGNLRTRATHEPSGNWFITDAPVDNKGKGEYFSPTDLTAVSLLTCMVTVMGILAQEKNIPFSKVESYADKYMASNPRRIERIAIHMKVYADGLDEKSKEMLRQVAVNCPVAKSLHPELIQDFELAFVGE